VPLVSEARSWDEGVYKAATMGSETTAAASGAVGEVRRDPFAMLPFCGYHMGDYIQHWLDMGMKVQNPPRIFSVNWFRKGDDGRFVWPGFGQNMRVLKWIFERCAGRADAVETPLGYVPRYDDFDWNGSDFDPRRFSSVMHVDVAQWERELTSHDAFFDRLGAKRPRVLMNERDRMAGRMAM
jgi:phosphoenolpyruvate carboxykinase (GTP)